MMWNKSMVNHDFIDPQFAFSFVSTLEISKMLKIYTCRDRNVPQASKSTTLCLEQDVT
jgi:hypothetical protein